MVNEITRMLDEYWAWLKNKTILRQLNNRWLEITTPYLDRHNDYIQIYAKRHNGAFLLTDDGYTIQDLKQSGCSLDSPKRQNLLKMTLNGFGIQNINGALEVHASGENFCMRKHNLLQAILAVNDLFYLAAPLVANLFYEDVVNWLDLFEVRYTPKVKFTGKSGYDHMFDFVIPKSKVQPERIIKTINSPKKDTAQMMTFAWLDTKEVRSPDDRAYAILNNSEHVVSASVIDALRNYEVTPVLWNNREDFREELAA